MTPLIPPDFKRCQCIAITYNPWVMGGSVYSEEQCKKKPRYIATEKKPGPGGKRGSMSLCGGCKKHFDKAVAAGKTPAATFKRLK